MPKVWAVFALVAVLLVTPCVASAQAVVAACQENPNKIFVTGAWVHGSKIKYSLSRSQPFLGVRSIDYCYDYDAFQVGLGFPLELGTNGEYGKLIIDGTITVPTSSVAEDLFIDTAGAALVNRKWNAKISYATLEGLLAYPASSGCGSPTWSALAGFRWVNWQTSYSGPYEGVLSAPSDRADLTVNAYLPLIGLMGRVGGITVGALGFPTTLGNVEHNEDVVAVNRLVSKGSFKGGYFGEIFADYTVPSYECAGLATSFSIFAKASWLSAPGTVNLKDLTQPVAPDRSFDFSFFRNLAFLGAKATVNFSVPSFGGLL